jgi:hypothetical protein
MREGEAKPQLVRMTSANQRTRTASVSQSEQGEEKKKKKAVSKLATIYTLNFSEWPCSVWAAVLYWAGLRAPH